MLEKAANITGFRFQNNGVTHNAPSIRLSVARTSAGTSKRRRILHASFRHLSEQKSFHFRVLANLAPQTAQTWTLPGWSGDVPNASARIIFGLAGAAVGVFVVFIPRSRIPGTWP